jgi:pimeloyl-ACP methyl ester carboxylesterase
LGCLVRLVGAIVLLVGAAILVRRLLERDVPIPRPGSGEHDTVVHGVRWRTRETPGAGAQDPVIYVAGWVSSSSTWKRVLSGASAGRAAIAPDLPGTGYSDRPWPYDYTVGGQAEHLLEYLDARGIGRFALVGNSLGGAVCETIAAMRPERVSALVLVDAAWPRMRIPFGFRLLRTPVVGELQLELLSRPVMAFTLSHRLYARGSRVNNEIVDDWWLPIRVPGTRRAALEAIRTNVGSAEGLLPRITAPTLVVWGKEDGLLPPSEGLALSEAIAGARFVTIPDAGHLPQEETPENFSRTVAGFLREAPNALSAPR